MAGGLINIVTYGSNDLYLTGSPQITFFKVVYRRYTNFSTESIAINVGDVNFGDEFNVQFPRVGDLFNKTYLQFEIPKVHLLKTDLIPNDFDIEIENDQINMSSDEINIANNYQNIIDFQTMNCQAYRYALANKNILNQTTQAYVTGILNAGNFIGATETNYITALNLAITYEHSINNYNDDFKLTYQNSDINYILNTNVVNPNAYGNYTVAQIFMMIQSAVVTSVKVKKYFFNMVKKYSVLERETLSDYAKFAWVGCLGNAMIDRIDVNIGGEKIDRHYADWINIWHELTGFVAQEKLYNKLIGNVPELTTFDKAEKPAYLLTIPLSFWFCRKAGLSFPIIALQYNTVSLTIKLKPIDNCAYVEELNLNDNDDTAMPQLSIADIWENKGYVMNCNILVDYVYLDSMERKRFAQSMHEYLIETTQVINIFDTTDANQNIHLDFVGPCKEIIWIAQKTAYLNGNQTQKKLPFVYTINANNTENNPNNNPLVDAQLLLNGYVRFDKIFGKNYFNYMQPYVHHNRTPADGINMYSFALFPEEHQPSGTCNFSRIDNAIFSPIYDQNMFTYKLSDIDPNTSTDNDQIINTSINISVYATRYNILRFAGGFGGVAFKYMK